MIPIIQPPKGTSPELSRWLTELTHQVSGAFQNQEAEILKLRKEVDALKAKP